MSSKPEEPSDVILVIVAIMMACICWPRKEIDGVYTWAFAIASVLLVVSAISLFTGKVYEIYRKHKLTK